MDELIKLGTYRRSSRKETFLSQLQKQEQIYMGGVQDFGLLTFLVQYSTLPVVVLSGYFVCLL